MPAVETKELRRIYKGRDKNPDIVALESLSIAIEEGEVFGLLGPNGAGKTTLVKVLSTVLLPSGGSATVLGFDVEREKAAVRPLIGIVFGGDRGLYWRLTGKENLEYWAALYKVPSSVAKQRVPELLERFGLGDRANSTVETYSRGMKQRLHLARGLIGDARVLFLDEPTTGMDPIAAHDFRKQIHALREEGRTILLTTHDMAEAESVCDRVALIDHGRLIAMETPRTLSRVLAQHERIDFEATEALAEQVRDLTGVASVSSLVDGSYRAEVTDEAALKTALKLLVDAGVTFVRTSRPSLEEVYVHVIGDRGLKL